MIRVRVASILATLCVLLAACGRPVPEPRFGQETRVLVVANAASGSSLRLARRYIEARGIARSHYLELRATMAEEIDRQTFAREIEAPLLDWWRACPDSTRPSYLLLLRGLPLKIRGSSGRDADQSSVDSELALVPRVARGERRDPRGRVPNPYYQPTRIGPYEPFDPVRFDLLLACRLDAYSDAECESLIARGLRAEAAPELLLLDAKTNGSEEPGDRSLHQAEVSAAAAGIAVRLDSTAAFVEQGDGLIGYASWGSNDPSYRRDARYSWRAGALAATFVSTSARTFREPPADWTPGHAGEAAHEFEGSTQSLIGDLIRSGATGVTGSVYEPFLDGCARPDLLFPAYFSGLTLGESFYLSLAYVSWMSVVVGDPLVAPFARAANGEAGAPAR